MTVSQLAKLLEETASGLTEHFDAVQILASYHDDQGTQFITRGSGNYYARQGMAHVFIKTEEAETTARAIAENDGDSI